MKTLLKAFLLCLVFSFVKATDLAATTISIKPREPVTSRVHCKNCHRPGKTKPLNPDDKILPLHGKHFRHFEKAVDFHCTICHSNKNFEMLNLLTGVQIPFTEPQKLCAQCHGIVLRRWEMGIHGKRVGSWQNESYQLLCLECHNPHKPKFDQYESIAVPIRPRQAQPHQQGETK